MKTLQIREALLGISLLLLGIPACAQTGKPPVRPHSGNPSPEVGAMYANACFQGIEPGKEVCLKDGRSEGPPVVVLRPEKATGDLDGDGKPETALLLTKSPGDPLQEVYLAVVVSRNGRTVNLATALLGNQVRVQSFAISGGKLHLQGQRSASARTAMMPATMTFTLREGKLVEEM